MAPAAAETPASSLGTASEFLPDDADTLHLLTLVDDIRGAFEGMQEALDTAAKHSKEIEAMNLHGLCSGMRKMMERKLKVLEEFAYLGSE